ncbi:zinc finger protein, putative [Schistosoma mansoni]|uniref:zinc finger protein, putative n=1 Tax=Schistosoma mansoni TaxID=6183 RepID=UPI00022C875A|nr:zinc finger protein, putative [Schistosoma mansoni]|eukprot:XP_018645138.1 zinc finger protein, putative [Schistosoma mansoni]
MRARRMMVCGIAGSLTSSSSAYANVKSSELYDLNINVDSLQLSFEATPESVATLVDEGNDFPTLTIQHNTTSLTGHNCSEAIYVNECLPMATNAPTFNCSNLNNESNFHETLQKQNPIPLDSNVTDNNHTSNSIINYEGPNYETYLNCPLCRVTFENWPNLEYHLCNEHTTNNVAPVCWRCQGIFKNHAVLLAHECFDWGRLYLPCTVHMNKSLKSFRKFSKIDLERKQFPMDGVFLSRRCGLCYKSNVTFTSYDAFEKHKSSSHSTTGRDGGYEPPTSRPLTTSTRKKTQSLKRARRLKAVAFECDSIEKHVTDEVDDHLSTTTALSCDVPPSPSIGSHISEGEIQLFRNRRSSWLHCHKNTRRLKLQLKRKMTITGRQRVSASTLFTNYAFKIRRFICNHCSAVFRLSSRLRAHYLFQHGLITRLRKRKAVRDNNSITMDASIQNAKRIERQTNDIITNTSSNNNHNDENEITGLLHENFRINEIDEQLISKSTLLYKQHYCTECNCTFKSAYNLKRHQKIVHLHEYRYFCGYCEFRTGERLAYEEHLARHFCVKQFICEICNARFTNKHELDDHRAFKHSNERNFACTECDQRFKTAGTLWRHKKTHEKRVYHLCPICPTSFTRLSNLNRHLLRTHKLKHHHQSINNHDELLMMDSTKKLSTSQRSTSLNNKQKRTRSCQPCSKLPSNINNHETSLLNQNHVSSCQQTVEQVIPVEIITPHLPGSDLSSNHQTLMNIIPDQDSRSSNIINISDNIDKSILISPTISTSCSDTSSSSLPSTIPKILPTQDHVIVTTECSIIPTDASGYQAVDLDNNSTVFMLNFSDLDANSRAFFEPTDVLSDSHDNLQHKMMIAVRDPVYEQATAFPTSLVVSSSSSSLSNGTLTSSTLSSSPKVAGTTITLQSNLLLPIQLTTNSFSAITTSSISHNTSVNPDVITNNNDTNSWSTMISRQLEPSLCYLITATETIENGVLCSHSNDATNVTGLNVDNNDDIVNGMNIVEDTPQSISSVDILNSLHTDMVDNMMNGTVLKIGSQSPQLSLANSNCIFYETRCSSTLTTTHSSVHVPASSSLSSSSCPNSSSLSSTSINQSTSIWRPVDCETPMLNKQENRPFQARINPHYSTINTANNTHNNNPTNNHNATSVLFTGDDGDAYPVEYYDQRYHQIQHVFPLMSKAHDSFIYDEAEEEDSDYAGLANNHVSTNNLTISNNNKAHQITTGLLDTSVMLSWNPTNDNNNNHSTEFLDYPHYSPKFPSPDSNNLSPSSIHLDRQQHQQPFELLSFPQSRHDQIISNPVTSLTGVLSPSSLLSPSSSISTPTPSSSSSLLYENNFNDCANFLGQFYHHNTSISNINLSYKNSYNTLSNTPNIMNNIENTCYSAAQLNDHDEIPDVTDQCSNFSVGYLIGHSNMPPSSSSSSSIASSSSRCLLLQTGEKTEIISSICQSSNATSSLITVIDNEKYKTECTFITGFF